MTTTSRAIFAESGHFTAMPNALLDWVQPKLSLSAWAVLCVIVRRTRGWGKKYDAISYEQIMAATGIKSTATISKALNELLSETLFGKPLLRRQRSSERTASCREATRYALNPRFEIAEDAQSGRREEKKGSGDASPAGGLSGESENAVPMSSSLHSSFPSLECGALESEGPERIAPLDFEAPGKVRASKNEDTKEPPDSYREENSRCVDAHRTDASDSTNTSDSSVVSSSLLACVCAATLRDPAVVSVKMRGQLVACAHRLERAGYSCEQVERAVELWPYPTAPTPAQLLDNIAALLGARPHRAKPSNPAAPVGAAPPAKRTNRSGESGTERSASRFECAAQRKSRKWASWLAELGDECCR